MLSMDLRQNIGLPCGSPAPKCSHQHDQERPCFHCFPTTNFGLTSYPEQEEQKPSKGGNAQGDHAGELDAVQLPKDQQVQGQAAEATGRPRMEIPHTIILVRLDCAQSTMSASFPMGIDRGQNRQREAEQLQAWL